jgi:hypothetical protein
MDGAVKEAKLHPHIKCLAHTLNLTGLTVRQAANLLAKIRRIVGYFHRSTFSTSMLNQKQELCKTPIYKLIKDVPTRWNSSYDMLERYLEQQLPISAVLMNMKNKEKDLPDLSDYDIKSATDLMNVLQPMKTITTMLCEEKIPTVSLIVPLQERIKISMQVNNFFHLQVNHVMKIQLY